LAGRKNGAFNDKDKALIRLLQEELPICAEPYREIARRLGMEHQEVLERVKRWVDQGVIRRLGATVYHTKVGYKSNCMVVWRLDDPNRHREVGELFAKLPQVTHCYRRGAFKNWPYTLYTMIHGSTKEDIENLLNEMSAASGLKDYQTLFSVKEWKKSSMKYFSEKESF